MFCWQFPVCILALHMYTRYVLKEYLTYTVLCTDIKNYFYLWTNLYVCTSLFKIYVEIRREWWFNVQVNWCSWKLMFLMVKSMKILLCWISKCSVKFFGGFCLLWFLSWCILVVFFFFLRSHTAGKYNFFLWKNDIII